MGENRGDQVASKPRPSLMSIQERLAQFVPTIPEWPRPPTPAELRQQSNDPRQRLLELLKFDTFKGKPYERTVQAREKLVPLLRLYKGITSFLDDPKDHIKEGAKHALKATPALAQGFVLVAPTVEIVREGSFDYGSAVQHQTAESPADATETPAAEPTALEEAVPNPNKPIYITVAYRHGSTSSEATFTPGATSTSSATATEKPIITATSTTGATTTVPIPSATHTSTPEPSRTPSSTIELEIVGPDNPHAYHPGLRDSVRFAQPIGGAFTMRDGTGALVPFVVEFRSTMETNMNAGGAMWTNEAMHGLYMQAADARVGDINMIYINKGGELVFYATSNIAGEAGRQREVLSEGNNTHLLNVDISYSPQTRTFSIRNLSTGETDEVKTQFPLRRGNVTMISEIATEDVTLERFEIDVSRDPAEDAQYRLERPPELDQLGNRYHTALAYPRETARRLLPEEVVKFGEFVNVSSMPAPQPDEFNANFTSYYWNNTTKGRPAFNSALYDELWLAKKNDKKIMATLGFNWEGQWAQETRFDLPTIDDFRTYVRNVMTPVKETAAGNGAYLALDDLLTAEGHYTAPSYANATSKNSIARIIREEVPEGAKIGFRFSGSLLSPSVRSNIIGAIEELRSEHNMENAGFIQIDAHQDISAIRLLAEAAEAKGIEVILEHIDAECDIEGIMDIAREFGNIPVLDFLLPQYEERTNPTTPDRIAFPYDTTEPLELAYHVLVGEPIRRIAAKVKADEGAEILTP